MYSVRTKYLYTLCYILILLFLSFTCVLMLSFHSTIAIDIFLTQQHDLFCGYILFYCFPRPVNLRFCRCFRQTGFFRRCCFKIAATTLYSRLSWNGCSLTSRARWNSVSASHKRPRFFISSPKLTKVRVSLRSLGEQPLVPRLPSGLRWPTFHRTSVDEISAATLPRRYDAERQTS